MMNAHVNPQQVLNFKGRSLLAFVLEPVLPLDEWFAGLDAWLVRSPTFFAQKPVILAMSELEIDRKDYRDLLGALARRHIRVMGVENPSRALVGPHLPPVVSGGRTVNAAALIEDEAPAASAPAKAPAPEPLFVDGNLRSGQSIMHPDGDVTIVGRVASGAEIVAGGSIHIYGASAGAGDRRHLRFVGGAHLLPRGARRAPVHRRRLRDRRNHGPRVRGSEPRGPAGRRRSQDPGPGLTFREDRSHEQGDRRHIR